VAAGSIGEFWDARAKENPFFFVDNRLSYSEPDLERFWAGGVASLDRVLGSVGAELGPDDDVVEIGCGVGRLTREIAHRSRSVLAIDVSAGMIDAARALNGGLENVEWLVGDGRSLQPIGDESADACVSDVVFQHIPEPAITLGYVAEIARVLRPGGRAAFQVSNNPAIHHRRPARERLRVRLRAALGRGPRGQTHAAWLGSAVDLDDLRATAARSGAEVERVTGAGTQFCYVLLRKL
jgi:SAM-dependent methyltransferase